MAILPLVCITQFKLYLMKIKALTQSRWYFDSRGFVVNIRPFTLRDRLNARRKLCISDY